MSPLDGQFGFSKKIIALAIAAVCSPAHAQDETEMAQLTKPDTAAVSVGVGAVSGDSKSRSLFGQYNGLRKDDTYLLLDLDYIKRDDATGIWTIFEGRDLGLTTREVRFGQQRQGDWKYYGEYSELVRYYPRTINTSLQGAGTTPVVTRLPVLGTGQDLDLQTKRKGVGLGGEKWITPNLMFEATFKNEDKDGARIFGRGFNCPSGAAPTPVCTALAAGANQWAILLLPEPINSTIRQFEAKLTYVGDKLALTGGYYGSFYINDNGAMTATVNGNLNNPLGNPMGQNGSVPLTTGLRNILQLPTALPPDNQAHQFYVSGNYAFTPTTRANFKVAYTHATQSDDFASNGLTGGPPGVNNYGGVLNTTLAQFGLTARPMPKLSLNANVRYEDRKDESPLHQYNIEGTNTFTNGTYSLKKTAAKVEGSYQLPADIRATLGVDYEALDRGQLSSPECIDLGDGSCLGDSVAGISGLRAKTWETGYRAELRKSLADTLSGAISYVESKRDGSSWLRPLALPATGVVELSDSEIFNRTGIFPMLFMDRTRKKVKALADWSPMERLSLQFTVEDGKDEYSAPTEKGLRDTGMRLFGVDASYAVSDAWKLSAYYTYSEQTLHVSHSTGYIADLEDRNNTAGISLVGKPTGRFEFGADLLYINDRNIYAQGLDQLASATNVAFLAQSGGLPDVTYRDLRLTLFGKYALQKNADIRVDVVHDRQKLNEWTWGSNGVPFAYSDNTTVSLNPDQNVTFVSVSYTYRWR